LRGASFDGCVLDGWDLSSCDLTGASFKGAKVRGLKADGSVGLDLSGSESLDLAILPGNHDDFDEIGSLIAQIEKRNRGNERRPLLEKLLTNYFSDDRAWKFLRESHLKRERVGSLVAMIIQAWEKKTGDPHAGVELMRQLLGRSGSPYITVRARLLRDFAGRVGNTDELFDMLGETAKREGWWSTGSTALSILAKAFSGEERAANVMRSIVTESGWFGARADAVKALIQGFYSPDTCAFLEKAIEDNAIPAPHRATILYAYANQARTSEAAARLATDLFEKNENAELRAAATSLRIKSGDLSKGTKVEEILSIARADRHHEVRSAVMYALPIPNIDSTKLLLERATEDNSSTVRRGAVSRLTYFVQYSDIDWFRRVFEQDSDDEVRSIALSHLLVLEGETRSERLREILIHEISRATPGIAAGRSAAVLLERWPNDGLIRRLATELLGRGRGLLGGWRSTIIQELQKTGLHTEN